MIEIRLIVPAGISSGSIISFISELSEAEMEKLEDLLRTQADSSGPLNDVDFMEYMSTGYASQL